MMHLLAVLFVIYYVYLPPALNNLSLYIPPYPPKPVNSTSLLSKEKGSTDKNVVQEIPQSKPFGRIATVG